MNEAGGGDSVLVPTLVPNPGSPTVTQGNLPGHEFISKRSVVLPWVTLDREICSLKIRVCRTRDRVLSIYVAVNPCPVRRSFSEAGIHDASASAGIVFFSVRYM